MIGTVWEDLSRPFVQTASKSHFLELGLTVRNESTPSATTTTKPPVNHSASPSTKSGLWLGVGLCIYYRRRARDAMEAARMNDWKEACLFAG